MILTDKWYIATYALINTALVIIAGLLMVLNLIQYRMLHRLIHRTNGVIMLDSQRECGTSDDRANTRGSTHPKKLESVPEDLRYEVTTFVRQPSAW